VTNESKKSSSNLCNDLGKQAQNALKIHCDSTSSQFVNTKSVLPSTPKSNNTKLVEMREKKLLLTAVLLEAITKPPPKKILRHV
jgi:hypothetical protein